MKLTFHKGDGNSINFEITENKTIIISFNNTSIEIDKFCSALIANNLTQKGKTK